MPTLRISAALAVGLMVAAGVAPAPPEWGSARAQVKDAQVKSAPVRKKAERKTPKAAPKEALERAPFTLAEQQAAVIPGMADARIWGDSEADFVRLLPQGNGPWLAISGGGSDGAFGGGVIAGWTQAGSRPEFTVVTGVSIGALLAPFAFLGPRYDDDVRKTFTMITAADVFEDRMSRDSLLDHWPLRRSIEQRVTPAMLAEVAAEHARGRRLLIATTNLDAERRVVWNMGAIAARADEQALKLFRDVLLASCSIPGFFAPVAIDVEANGKKFQELHGDGTLTAPFFVAPESMLSSTGRSRPPIGELYVLVNSKLAPDFQVTDRTIAGVLGRSISVALTAALGTEITLMQMAARHHQFALRIAHVDAAFSFPQRGPFDGRYMQALYAFGFAAGQKGTAFQDKSPEALLRGSTKQ